MAKINRIKLRSTIVICLIILLFFIVGILIKIYHDDSNSYWKQEYVEVMETWKQESKEDILGYDFVYLNSDDIPELVLYCNDEAWAGFDIYTIINGKAVRLELYNFTGEKEGNALTSNGRQGQGDSYLYKQGVLLQSGGMMGCYAISSTIHNNNYNDYIKTSKWKLYDLELINNGPKYNLSERLFGGLDRLVIL